MSSNIITISDQEYNRATLLAQDFGTSGLFPNIKNKAQAMVMISIGREIGVSAVAAMTGIHLIGGKPVIGANLMAERIKAKGSYDYEIVELTDKVCKIKFFKIESGKKREIGLSEFTWGDAVNAQLIDKSNSNWKKYPRNMLFARALSNGQRWYCPDVFNGATVYTPDEMGATVNDIGELDIKASRNIIDAEPVTNINYQTISEKDIETIRSILSSLPNPAASEKWIIDTISAEVKESYAILEDIPAKYSKITKRLAEKAMQAFEERQKKLSELHANLEKFSQIHQLEHDPEIVRSWLKQRAGVESMTELTTEMIQSLIIYVKKTISTEEVDEDFYVFYKKQNSKSQTTFPEDIQVGSKLEIAGESVGVIESINNERTEVTVISYGGEKKNYTINDYLGF